VQRLARMRARVPLGVRPSVAGREEHMPAVQARAGETGDRCDGEGGGGIISIKCHQMVCVGWIVA
jgi:hypothetical protein